MGLVGNKETSENIAGLGSAANVVWVICVVSSADIASGQSRLTCVYVAKVINAAGIMYYDLIYLFC